MRNTVLKLSIVLSVLCSYNSNSQIIVNMAGDNNTYPSGYLSTGQYYIKDVNNYLNNFTGTWEYVDGNEKFQIVLTKINYFHQTDTDLNLNYYEDGIVIRYKKFMNNTLIFESPNYDDPNFRTKDGLLLTGNLKDYGRLTRTIYYPYPPNSTEIFKQGSNPIYPNCRIEKLPTPDVVTV